MVDKPPGLLVHRTRRGSNEEALLQRLRDQLAQPVHPIHRLDRDASGLLAYGLDRRAARELQAGLQAPDAVKEYIVLVSGACTSSFDSRAPLVDDHGVERDAHTEFQRVERFPGLRLSLLRARLHSGRGNQIRRHLALLRLHVCGDPRYGKARVNRHLRRRFGLERLFLHATRLEIPLPGGRLVVEAPLAPDLTAVLALIADLG